MPEGSNSQTILANLPIIEHPNSRLGNTKDMCLTGIRSKSNVNQSSFHHLDGWPPEFTKQPAQFMNKDEITHGLTPDDLDIIIRNHLTTSYHGLRHHFKGNDATGQGHVSRAGLLRILRIICGQFSLNTFNAFLLRHGMQNQRVFVFEPFVALFQDNELVQNEWLRPTTNLSLHTKRWGALQLPEEPVYTIATQAIPRLRLKVIKSGIQQFLPKSCFERGGMIVAPQLREAMAQLNLRMSDTEFMKFWIRCDVKRIGAIRTSRLFQILGLDQNGLPQITYSYFRPSTGSNRAQNITVPHAIMPGLARQRTGGEDTTAGQADDLSGRISTKIDSMNNESRVKVRDLLRNHQTALPAIDTVINCLHYRFEEPFQLMLAAFQLFDFLNDGFISRIDFRFVCGEFGFSVNVVELDKFLTRNGIQSVLGQMSYRDILTKLQTRAPGSTAHQIMIKKLSGVADDSIEAKMVDFLHADFLKFITNVRLVEKDGISQVSKHDLQSVIEKVVNSTSLTKMQWDKFWLEVAASDEGFVPYNRLLETLNIAPGSWNRVVDSGHTVCQVHTADLDTSPLDQLKEIAQSAMTVKKDKRALNRVEESDEKIKKYFSFNYNTFDELYRESDRRSSNRVSLWQFGALLRKVGLDIPLSHITALWHTMEVQDDGMLSYNQIIRRFCPHLSNKVTRPEPELTLTDNALGSPPARGDDAGSASKQRSKTSSVCGSAETTQAKPPPSLNAEAILERIRPIVLHNWVNVKNILKKFDTFGHMTVTHPQFESLLNSETWGLTKDEREAVYEHFRKGINGRFNYLNFLNYFIHSTDLQEHPQYINKGRTMYDRLDCRLEPNTQATSLQKGSTQKNPKTIADVTVFIRDQILHQYKNMWLGFRKIDKNKNGYLESSEFRRILLENGIRFSDNDFYHIMAQYDTSLDGRISYREFLDECCNI